MDKKLIKAYLPWGLCAGIFTIAAASGLFYEMDNRLSDALYQERRGTDGRIAIVGIDQRSLEALGPFGTWDRRILAQTVSYLNQGDIRPAVIGLDVLLAGENGTEGDLLLAEAAGTGENVVTAAAGTFGSSLVTAADGTFYLDDFTVKSFDEPYKALRDVTAQGHINAMYDKDGILRHQLLELGLPDGRVFPSFALTIARKYIQQEGGREAGLPPVDSRGFWYLNYSGLPEDYSEFISIVDLLEENIPPEYFADRIVLIGPYAAGLGDQYITSADRGDPMYGVEIQANAIHALLEGDYKEEPGAGIQLAVLFLVRVG